MRSPRPLALLALPLLLARPVLAQSDQDVASNRYERLYGAPVDVQLSDLMNNPMAYEGRSVRTSGRLETVLGFRQYAIRDGFHYGVFVQPVPDVSRNWEFEAPSWVAREVQVTGVFGRRNAVNDGVDLGYAIQFWRYLGPPEKVDEKQLKAARAVTLESLVRNPGKNDGQMVRVVGKFRGRNLYGDLPVKSQKSSADWVIKDDLYAAWITGKKPKGSGWSLDAGLKRDTGKWVEVVGRVETRSGIPYLKAERLSLTSAPTPTAEAQPPPPPPERPKVPPVVVFALPLDGEREVPRDARFYVQFSKDMDEDSFKGRVRLRYAGPRLPGDRDFDAVKVSYDGGRRALIVEPGDLLRPGRHIELILMPGIADLDGLGLTPRPGHEVPGAADVLRWEVGL